MYEVNRSVFLLIPLEPFWAWLQNLPDIDLEELSLEVLQQDANAYLTSAREDANDLWTEVEQRYQDIFAAELADWCEDESLWPTLSFDNFKDWFGVQISTVVTDLAQEELARETFVSIVLN
ncbi:MAG: VacJ [Snodgrassella sp.]|uniref:VacJ n=1 Tax=Snodgrassella sp. TaxID=2815304 RepID=UPI002586BDEB|nr:VacJ [Snodgrassella sp.]MCO6508091.1 VacJ [Snodgrassella sp.]